MKNLHKLSLLCVALGMSWSSAHAQTYSVGSADCAVTYTVTKTWNGGFNADVVATNRRSTAIDGWISTWSFAGGEKIGSSWRSGLVSAGPAVELRGLDYNRTIAPNGTVQFGFTASGTPAMPRAFALNGRSCQSAAPPPPPPPPTSCSNSRYPIPQDIRLHTILSTVIARPQFPNHARWYQESGNTQIFRLYNGDTNQATDRPNPRVETFSFPTWQARDANDWHEFSADYSIVKTGLDGRTIFQMKSQDEAVQWEVMIGLQSNGDILLNHRRNNDEIIARNMVGKTFNLRVRSNGRRYQVYYNCQLVTDSVHQMDPSGRSSYAWRWGMYLLQQRGDSEIRVTGPRFD
jgi:hypothetical protein